MLMRSIGSILLPPLLCLGVLAGIRVEKSTQLNPKDAEPYHAQAKRAVEAIPYTFGSWTGSDKDVPEAAVKLLRPNVITSRVYIDNSRFRPRKADVLIVQCQDSRDMVGHYPEKCYPQSGRTLRDKRERDWVIGGRTIPGVEYHFEKSAGTYVERFCIYNFLLVPGRGIVRDIDGVNKAAEDYQRRYFGAAQFQFLMSEDYTRAERDAIFAELMGEMVQPLQVLASVNVTKKAAPKSADAATLGAANLGEPVAVGR